MKNLLLVIALFVSINVAQANERYVYTVKTENINQTKIDRAAKKHKREVKKHNKRVSKNAKKRVKYFKRSHHKGRYYGSNHKKITSKKRLKLSIKAFKLKQK